MPFDALTDVIPPTRFSNVLAHASLRPVSREALEAHKRAQLERFSPSFWYRHRRWLGIGLLASITTMAFVASWASQSVAPGSKLPVYIMTGWMAVITLLIGGDVMRLRSGSHWEERWIPAGWLESSEVPPSIAARARLLQADLPGSTLILGELVQDTAVLDPYLLLEYRGERICLGIWDGDEVIESIERY